MSDEQIGKGEARLEPVDVDVIDNLINAQAAFMEALQTAVDHIGGGVSDEAAAEIGKCLSFPVGIIITKMAERRV